MSGKKARQKRQQLTFTAQQADQMYRAYERFTVDLISAADALLPVEKIIFGMKTATTCNGGEDTARTLARLADELAAAVSTLQRQFTAYQRHAIAYVNPQTTRELLGECTALRSMASMYSNASPADRPGLQRRIQAAVSASEDMLARAKQPPPSAERLAMVAGMIRSRVARTTARAKYRAALADLKQSDPAIFAEFFPHETSPEREAYARKLVSRYP